MYASALGSIDAMKLLLKAGADVNAKNAFDATALMWCIDQPDMVRLLLTKGADLNARSKMGRTPLLLAASYGGNSEVVKLLLARGANVMARDDFEITPLIAATQANDLATVKLLLEQGADIKGVDIHSKEMAERVLTGPASAGFTPLMFAAAEGNVEVVRLLLARGADVNAACLRRNLRGLKRPLELASFTASDVGRRLPRRTGHDQGPAGSWRERRCTRSARNDAFNAGDLHRPCRCARGTAFAGKGRGPEHQIGQ